MKDSLLSLLAKYAVSPQKRESTDKILADCFFLTRQPRFELSDSRTQNKKEAKKYEGARNGKEDRCS